MMKVEHIINLTPHAINIITANGKTATIRSSGSVARVATKTVKEDNIVLFNPLTEYDKLDNINITRTEYSDVEGLPDPVEGTIYIVSSLVAQRVPGRDDVFIPNESVRDDQGRIIGCKSLGRI